MPAGQLFYFQNWSDIENYYPLIAQLNISLDRKQFILQHINDPSCTFVENGKVINFGQTGDYLYLNEIDRKVYNTTQDAKNELEEIIGTDTRQIWVANSDSGSSMKLVKHCFFDKELFDSTGDGWIEPVDQGYTEDTLLETFDRIKLVNETMDHICNFTKKENIWTKVEKMQTVFYNPESYLWTIALVFQN